MLYFSLFQGYILESLFPDSDLHFDLDPDPNPTSHFDRDLDPTFHFDPDPDPAFFLRIQFCGPSTS
jgi:hypothetical protein